MYILMKFGKMPKDAIFGSLPSPFRMMIELSNFLQSVSILTRVYLECLNQIGNKPKIMQIRQGILLIKSNVIYAHWTQMDTSFTRDQYSLLIWMLQSHR